MPAKGGPQGLLTGWMLETLSLEWGLLESQQQVLWAWHQTPKMTAAGIVTQVPCVCMCVGGVMQGQKIGKNRHDLSVSWELQGPFWGTRRCQTSRYCRDDFNSFVAHWNSGRLPGKQYNSLVPQQMSKSVTRLKNEKYLTAHLQNCAQTPSE